MNANENEIPKVTTNDGNTNDLNENFAINKMKRNKYEKKHMIRIR